ncbi:MAG: histone deacetylase [Salinivirgaceae bacterium]|jgi:acetoin utilization deacetylase AcuC-like enzyme|nr:histone deacetylase [Salinivirgaceae bacterium]
MIHLFYNELYHLDLPIDHRFPMLKYPLIQEQLLYEETFETHNFVSPRSATNAQIGFVHTTEYIHKLENELLSRNEIRRTGFPYSKALVQREKIIAGGTIDATYSALQHRIAFNLAGGTHHAYPEHGEGFCIFNDIAIAATEYRTHNPNHPILIIDLDVHQGNGTAHIFKNTPEVFTFSIHGAKNYPLHKEKSDLDIAVEEGITDSQYLALVSLHVNQLIQNHKPQMVYYLAGVDILNTDKLGKIGVSKATCRERDIIVLQQLRKHNIPVVVVMGGGYAHRLADIVDAHCNTFRVAKNIFE